MKDKKNFLILGHNYVGDVLMLTPAIRAIKLRFPDSRITVAVSREASAVLRRNPDIYKIIEFDKNRMKGVLGFLGMMPLFMELRTLTGENSPKFYGCINFLTSFKFTLLGFFLSEMQSGEFKIKNNPFLNYRVKISDKQHNVERSFELALPFLAGSDYVPSPGGCIYEVGEEDVLKAKNIIRGSFLKKDGDAGKNIINENYNLDNIKIALFSPGSTRQTKETRPALFSGFADFLNDRGFYVIITGTKRDMGLAGKIFSEIKNKELVADLTGLTDIFTLGGLISISSLAVTVDNGTMHMASAIGTKLISIFGSTDPAVCGPYGGNYRIIDSGNDCVHCFSNRCGKKSFSENGFPDCMDSVTIDDMTSAFSELFGEKGHE